jgi:glutathione S-transferase
VSVTVFGIWGSPYVRSALLGCVERGVDYDFSALSPGQHREPPYLERHPFGRIPAIEHDGFRLYETQAILRYLARAFPGGPLEPKDARAAARMDQLMNIVDWYVFQHITVPVTAPYVMERLGRGNGIDKAAIAAALPKAEICLTAIEALMNGAPYLAGAAPTLADLMLAPHMSYFVTVPEGEQSMRGHPRLAEWIARMEERPSMIKTRPN